MVVSSMGAISVFLLSHPRGPISNRSRAFLVPRPHARLSSRSAEPSGALIGKPLLPISLPIAAATLADLIAADTQTPARWPRKMAAFPAAQAGVKTSHSVSRASLIFPRRQREAVLQTLPCAVGAAACAGRPRHPELTNCARVWP